MQVIPISPLLEEAFTHGQLQDVSPGCGQGFTWHPTSPLSLVSSVGVSCWSMLFPVV